MSRSASRGWRPVAVGLVLATGATPLPGAGAAMNGKTFRDWITRCEQPREGAGERCFIVQNLVLREKKQRVMIIAVAYPPDGADPVAVLTLPLGISLPPGVTIRVDHGAEHRFAIDRCLASGCKTGFVLQGELLESFKAGITAEITIHDAGRNPITLPVSLRGFTAALGSLR